MELAKLTIRVETAPGEFNKEVVALFNPNQIAIQKTTQWHLRPKPESDTGKSQFTHGDPATLSMELFFDTYASRKDVRHYTKQIFALTTVQEHGELHRPPLCKLEWGALNLSEDYDCQWVLQSLNQRFTLFLSDGTPVRATLGCTFRQWRGDQAEEQILKKSSADVAKTRVVRRGDTLASIAHEQCGDPSRWRPIAKANGVENPRDLPPGKRLIIPTLRSRSAIRR